MCVGCIRLQGNMILYGLHNKSKFITNTKPHPCPAAMALFSFANAVATGSFVRFTHCVYGIVKSPLALGTAVPYCIKSNT